MTRNPVLLFCLLICMALPSNAQQSASDKKASQPWQQEPTSFLGLKFHQAVDTAYSQCPGDPTENYDPDAEAKEAKVINQARVEMDRISSAAGSTITKVQAAREVAAVHTTEYNAEMTALDSAKARILADEFINPGIDGGIQIADGKPCFYRFDKLRPGLFSVQNLKPYNVHGSALEGRVEYIIATFDARLSGQVLNALLEKYGDPRLDVIEKIQTKAGVKYDRRSVSWSGSIVGIVYQSLSESTEVGSVVAITKEYAAKAKLDMSIATKDLGKTF